MRLWLNVLASAALVLAVPAAAAARGGGGAMFRPGVVMAHGNAGRPAMRATSPHTGEAERQAHSEHHPDREVFAAAGGYGVPWGYAGDYAGDYGPADAAGAANGFAPPRVYNQRPPQLTCFRPRLILIGHQAVQTAHLPKVVYGAPLPCGSKGS